MVKQGQDWLNGTYSGKSGFTPIPEKWIGSTNWTTMFALTRALQIELGISSTSDSFGPTTLSTLQTKYGTISKTSTVPKNVIKIIQTAMYCKGYSGGEIDGIFDSRTVSELARMKKNMGLSEAGTIEPKVFKALLTMDAYVLLESYGGSSAIRSIQQRFNSKYGGRSDYFYMPCDGIYSRDTQKALVFAIQYEGGMADGVANGNFGPGTQNIVRNNTVSVGSVGEFVYLLKAAMIFNGYDCILDQAFTNNDSNRLVSFQNFSKLPTTGKGDFQTWASLLVSTGDPNRKGTALDCVTEITDARAQALRAAGYETVGRYLTNVAGTSLNKKIQPGELDTIFRNGLTVFPIYQTWGGAESYFNYEQGVIDGKAAAVAAEGFGFNPGTIIYFAVDYDALGDHITNSIIPHFRGVFDGMAASGGRYSIGIYGPRNVCIKTSQALPIKTSFVCGMSTGFSGNLGYSLPENWSFDQISTISIGSGLSFIEIDNNIKSGRDHGQSSVNAAAGVNTPDVALESQYVSSLNNRVAAYISSVMTLGQQLKANRVPVEAADAVINYDAQITRISQKYGIRKALIQTVLMWEHSLEGKDDIAADSFVVITNAYYGQLDYWSSLPPVQQAVTPAPTPPTPVLGDCSTGFGQIFASTAIDAINYAVDRGLYYGKKYNIKDWKDVWEIWQKLHNDINFNIEICALVLIWGANDVGINGIKYSYTDQELKEIIARYNGEGVDAAAYGQRNLETYKIFEYYNELCRL